MNGIGGEKGGDWDDDGLPENQPFETTPFDEVDNAGAEQLPLNEDDRLPWLDSPDDVDLEDNAVDAGRIVGLIVLGVVALALILGAVYWLSHRGGPAGEADGSLIAANKDPYKVKPQDAGGKVFEGTGDTSFKVSEGLRPQGSVAASGAPAATASKAPAAATSAAPAAAASAAASSAAAATGGVGVQIGAFSSKAAAEAAWSRYQGQHEALKGVNHRIIEGKAEFGTVFRLQAVAGDGGAARTLCGTLSARGLKCQVK